MRRNFISGALSWFKGLVENVWIDNECAIEYELWDFNYRAYVLRSTACIARPGKLVCDDFTSKSRSGKNEFDKRKLRLLFGVSCKGLPLEKVEALASHSKLATKCELHPI